MVTYEFYQDVHFGELPKEIFNKQLPLAIKQFNNATFNRVTVEMAGNEVFKRCVCHLIDFNQSVKDKEGIVSTSDGVTSVSFDTSQTPDMQRQKILSDWLDGYYELTYRGF